jgi:hypothetical protein
MVTVWYPPNKNPEVAKKYVEVFKKFPVKSFEKMLVSATRSDKDGQVGIIIHEVEKGKLEEAYNLVAKRMLEFCSIKGYRHKIETFWTAEEAFAMLGLTPPK